MTFLEGYLFTWTTISKKISGLLGFLARWDECPESYCHSPGVGVSVSVSVGVDSWLKFLVKVFPSPNYFKTLRAMTFIFGILLPKGGRQNIDV